MAKIVNKHGIEADVPDELAEDLLANGNWRKPGSGGRRAKKDDGSTENQTGGGDGGQTPPATPPAS
ncbi:hypothetical protein SEA_FLAGSTAFF_8 [Mycobacterium phage FlagStaff]|uniref:Head-to-tail connector protein n=1 Tax=Mycobacterium phage FlagStaff TaxID=1647304 RepID=A0A0F6YQ56_9CAUD|nr:head-tail connector protein [Mycobacterium phage FlagStaff]AKF14445.1 hypothetical protein SEA_FLAGSTAFF_8 [Mycobacterium phage FlagStaff]